MSRRVRFPTAQDAPELPDPVPAVGPVAFSLYFDGAEQQFDLSDLPCPRLVRHLARAVAELGGDDGSQKAVTSVRITIAWLRDFVKFVAQAEPDASETFDLADMSVELLEAYEQKLIDRYDKTSSQAYFAMVGIIALLKGVHRQQPDAFDLEVQTRLGFATTTATNKSKPLNAYPFPVFDAIGEMAAADVRAIRDRILEGERLAAAGQDPDLHGWDKLENILWHIAHRGPLTTEHRKMPGIGKHIIRKFGGTRALNRWLFLGLHDVLPFLILLTYQTGLEPECVKMLKADCLTSPARGFVTISYVKKRAHSNVNKTMRISDGGALHFPGGVIRLALRLTQRGREATGSDLLWIDVLDDEIRGSFSQRRILTWPQKSWHERHKVEELADYGGVPARLDLRRLRKTYKSRQYLRAAGVLEDFAAGHSKETAASRYANIEAHKELHERAVEDGLQEALEVALEPPVVLDDDGQRLDEGREQLEPEEVAVALSGGNDVWLASCRNFYGSPYALKKGAGCPVAVWACLQCPNAVFTTRHLPSILSFLAFLEDQREDFSVLEWKARYGLAWERVVHGIRPRFSRQQVITAQAIAEAAGPRLNLPGQFLEAVT